MKTKPSRRKFITTTISGAVASIVAPVAFAGERPRPAEAKPTIMANNAFARETAEPIPKRVASSEFIIFPWGGMPNNPASRAWGDLTDMDVY